MTTRAADDYPIIRARMREIETEQGLLPPGCLCGIAETTDCRFRIHSDKCPVHVVEVAETPDAPASFRVPGGFAEAMAADRAREEIEGQP